MKNLLWILLLGAFVIVSCGDDEPDVDCTSNSFVNTINPTITALNSAGQTWANDPSQANCDAYKAAASDYLDAVQTFADCTEIADYAEQVAAAQQAVDDIPCN